MIEFQNVWYAYPVMEDEEAPSTPAEPAYALRGVSLTVREGEFLCILGHNGSGKSTLAKMMNALFLPTDGQVRVEGMDTAMEDNILPIRQRVGLVLQNPDNQLVTTVVEEDVAFGPENLGVPPEEIRRRVDEALAIVGLTDMAKVAPHRLSGGQKQRVAIAGILAMRPKILVMDEPTAMLDPQGRREVIRTAHQLKDEGMTVVLITHFMDEALRADRILVMEDGLITKEGTPREILRDQAALYAAGLTPPRAAQLAESLRKKGVPLPMDILTTEELVEGLCALKRRA